jgi:hypothetical protein
VSTTTGLPQLVQVVLTRVELQCGLRQLRLQRERLQIDLTNLNKRKVNAATQGAILALDAELAILDEVIRKLWVSN